MNIERNNIVSWKEFKTTTKFQRTPKSSMLGKEGFTTSLYRDGESWLVKYDRDYVVEFIYTRIIKHLRHIGKPALKSIFEEAIERSGIS